MEERITKENYYLACDPTRWLHKYLLLVFICFMPFGNGFCLIAYGALQKPFQETMEISASEFTFIHACHTCPGIITSFMSGLIIDNYIGFCWGGIVFSFIITLGHFLVTIGVCLKEIWIVYLGNLIIGSSGGPLFISVTTYLANWFNGKTLNLVFGLSLSINRLSSMVSMLGNPSLYVALGNYFNGNYHLGITIFFGDILLWISFFCSIIMGFFHKRAEKILKIKKNDKAKKLNFKTIKNFGFPFWVLSEICVFYYSTVFVFVSLAMLFYEIKFGLTTQEASFINSFTFLIGIILTPIIGYLIDGMGRNLFWILLAAILIFVSQLLLTFTEMNPYFSMAMIGISTSFFSCAFWPTIFYVASINSKATAYGLTFTFQKAGLTLSSYLVGVVLDKFGYFGFNLFFVLTSSFCLIGTLILFAYNSKKNGILNLTAEERKLFMDKKLRENDNEG